MSNPLFNQFGNINNNPLANIMQEARKLRETVNNPRQEVERLLQTGQMTQQQFNQYSQMANQIVTSMQKK